jgi:hypothetical protein
VQVALYLPLFVKLLAVDMTSSTITDDVTVLVARADKTRVDLSKSDRWRLVFDWAELNGIALYTLLEDGSVNNFFDSRVALGPQPKLYYREIVSRFGLTWDLGNSDSSSMAQRAEYLATVDPYNHPIVVSSKMVSEEIHLFHHIFELVGIVHRNDNPVVGYMQNIDPTRIDRDWFVLDNCVHWSDETACIDMSIRAIWGNFMTGGAGVYFNVDGPDGNQNQSSNTIWTYGQYFLDFISIYVSPKLLSSSAMNTTLRVISFGTLFPIDCWALSDKATEYFILFKPGSRSNVVVTMSNTTVSMFGRRTYWTAWYNPRLGGALVPASIPMLSASNLIVDGGDIDLGQPPKSKFLDWVTQCSSNVSVANRIVGNEYCSSTGTGGGTSRVIFDSTLIYRV